MLITRSVALCKVKVVGLLSISVVCVTLEPDCVVNWREKYDLI